MTPRALYDLVIPGVTVVEYRSESLPWTWKGTAGAVIYRRNEDRAHIGVVGPGDSVLYPANDENSNVLTRLWPRPGDEPIVLEPTPR